MCEAVRYDMSVGRRNDTAIQNEPPVVRGSDRMTTSSHFTYYTNTRTSTTRQSHYRPSLSHGQHTPPALVMSVEQCVNIDCKMKLVR